MAHVCAAMNSENESGGWVVGAGRVLANGVGGRVQSLECCAFHGVFTLGGVAFRRGWDGWGGSARGEVVCAAWNVAGLFQLII